MYRSILRMPTFRKPCSPLHQDQKQPDTELFLRTVPFILRYLLEWWGRGRRELYMVVQYQAAPRADEVDCKVHETLAFQEWIWTQRKLAKHIIFI
ncbi:hypothetical protein ALC57_01240 [Trachymyrmex cornetzi]|uniref:Uncharacterized protein n=1 Tax=Trachymyrmex cornetzi TaxID=471704 RepID=A0A151JQ13_9HYME|nr:hypothetical protein ALC57_01240 [Trachymyrmex cornetzi]